MSLKYRKQNMRRLSSAACLFSAISPFLLLASRLRVVESHGYMYSPRSLNWRAHEDGIEWGQAAGKTTKEYCYHCLNVKLDSDVCGNSGNKNYDDFRDTFGNPMPWKSEAMYTEGEVIQVKSHLAAHHYGHLEVKVCPLWENPTQACFDENPLIYEYDSGFAYAAPIDANYPHYGHYADANKQHYTHKFKLPNGVYGNKVLLQYHYITANSCNPPGYKDYDWPADNWWSGPYLGDCELPYPTDGSRSAGDPEQFWNCAQVTIKQGNSEPSTQAPATSPVVKTSNPTASPVFSVDTATTTRYWDCAGGACGCAYLPDHLQDKDLPAHCYSNGLFDAPPDNTHGAKFYGTAAISSALGGGDWLDDGCGKCWKVTGTCNTPSCSAGTTTLVLRGANFCPTEALHCETGKKHFDIAAPGFDVNGYSLSNNCKILEPMESPGFEACSTWMIDDQNPNINCECDRFDDIVLKKGCENFLSLGWDNPTVEYEEVVCPDEMVTPCWEENGGSYPKFPNIPETCSSPSGKKPPTPLLQPTSLPPTSEGDPNVTPYCNWGPLGTGESSVCDGVVQGGSWCNQNEQNCEGNCEGKWCKTSPGPSLPPVPRPPNGDKTATTTRYWDCSGGTCGCSYVPKGLNNPGEPSYCHSNAMFEAPTNNQYGAKYYGTAAVSYHLGGDDWMSEACGKCWKVTGRANIQKYLQVGETVMVIKGTNYCPPSNPLCSAGPHFDIAAPGFDVLKYSFAHTCPVREADEKDGFAACGNWLIDDQDPDINCDCSMFNNPILKAGCENFYSLKWDNAEVVYEELDECPRELGELHCGYPYADEKDMPDTCSSNVFEPSRPTAPLEPTKAPVSSPPVNCPEGWNVASWTWYQSYAPCCPASENYNPNYSTLECDQYSACDYLGSFAYAGQREYKWVKDNNLIAFFSTNGDNTSYGNKKIEIMAKGVNVIASVVDTCGDSDCDNCCTKNAQPSGYLIDMESHTVEKHFGKLNAADGQVCWKLDESPPTGYCSWYECDGEIQDDPYCNFDEHNCLGICGGSTYCPLNDPPPTPIGSPVAPTPIPTSGLRPPASPPTEFPVASTPIPTKGLRPTASPSASDAGCCSLDMKNCVGWCGTTQAECSTCGTSLRWIDGPQTNCIAHWVECTDDVGSCCKGLTCVGDQWHKGCEL